MMMMMMEKKENHQRMIRDEPNKDDFFRRRIFFRRFWDVAGFEVKPKEQMKGIWQWPSVQKNNKHQFGTSLEEKNVCVCVRA